MSNDVGILEDLDIPEICASCGKGISPIYCFHFAVETWRAWHGFLQIVFRCPLKDCQRLFIALYRSERGVREVALVLQTTYLLDHVEWEEFSDTIKSVSGKYDRIYNQAKIAELNGLDEIAGPGYGKALEFLIKDYLIHKEPASKDRIVKLTLRDAIGKIKDKDANIKKCAHRANFLRNDETHYEKRQEKHDIRDLKNLIRLTMNWIENSLLTEQYEKEIPIKRDSI